MYLQLVTLQQIMNQSRSATQSQYSHCLDFLVLQSDLRDSLFWQQLPDISCILVYSTPRYIYIEEGNKSLLFRCSKFFYHNKLWPHFCQDPVWSTIQTGCRKKWNDFFYILFYFLQLEIIPNLLLNTSNSHIPSLGRFCYFLKLSLVLL